MIRILFLLVFTHSSFALVDYTNTSAAPEAEEARPLPNSSVGQIKRRSNPNRESSLAKFLMLGMSYESVSVETQDGSGNVGLMRAQVHAKTLYNIFADLSYWSAQTNESEISKRNSIQNGNPTLKLGFNWLEIGDGDGAATIDLFGGVTMKGQNSDFSSSRNDTLFGMVTNKKMDRFVLALEGEVRLTGNPKREEELKIGNIRRLMAGIGWVASGDIRIALEASSIKVSKSDLDDGEVLQNDIAYSLLTPKLYLTFYRMVEIELGAHFRTRRPNNPQDILKARLIDLPGVYGNSLFAGLNIAI